MDTPQKSESDRNSPQNDRLVQRGYRVTPNSAVNPMARRAADARRRQSAGGRPVISQARVVVQQSQVVQTPRPVESIAAPVVEQLSAPTEQISSFEKAARLEVEVASNTPFESVESNEKGVGFLEKMSRFVPRSSLARTVIVGPMVAVLVLGIASMIIGGSDANTDYGAVAGASIGAPDFRYVSKEPIQSDVGKQSLDNHMIGVAEPRTISLFSDKIARTVSVGQTFKGTIATPDNVHDVGWFNQSASLDDEKGVLILTAYEAGDAVLGAFASIDSLVPGNIISIESGDGTQHSFKIVESNVYTRTRIDMTKVLQPVNPDVLGLNLISAGTAYETNDTFYSERNLVRAEKIEL